MNEKELFGVIIRTVGLLVALRGLWLDVWAVVAWRTPRPRYPWQSYAVSGVAMTLAGYLMLSWADGIARLFYR